MTHTVCHVDVPTSLASAVPEQGLLLLGACLKQAHTQLCVVLHVLQCRHLPCASPGLTTPPPAPSLVCSLRPPTRTTCCTATAPALRPPPRGAVPQRYMYHLVLLYCLIAPSRQCLSARYGTLILLHCLIALSSRCPPARGAVPRLHLYCMAMLCCLIALSRLHPLARAATPQVNLYCLALLFCLHPHTHCKFNGMRKLWQHSKKRPNSQECHSLHALGDYSAWVVSLKRHNLGALNILGDLKAPLRTRKLPWSGLGFLDICGRPRTGIGHAPCSLIGTTRAYPCSSGGKQQLQG